LLSQKGKGLHIYMIHSYMIENYMIDNGLSGFRPPSR